MEFRLLAKRGSATRVPRIVGRVMGREWFWWFVGLLAVAVVGSVLSWRFWGNLDDDRFRTAALVIGGVVTVLLALWRSTVAERRARAAHQQAATAQQGLLNDRYQKAAEMLGSKVLAVRVGAIHALQGLAKEYPHQYYIQKTRLLCAFARNPTKDSSIKRSPREEVGDGRELRDDVQAALEAIGSREGQELAIELEEMEKTFGPEAREPEYALDFEERYRKHLLNLAGADLSGATLWGPMNLSGADLSHVQLWDSDIAGADLSDAYLYCVKGLTNDELGWAAAKITPPDVRNSFCAKTGEPLEWKDPFRNLRRAGVPNQETTEQDRKRSQLWNAAANRLQKCSRKPPLRG